MTFLHLSILENNIRHYFKVIHPSNNTDRIMKYDKDSLYVEKNIIFMVAFSPDFHRFSEHD